MNKIRFAVILLISHLLLSCSKKDKDEKAFLYGSWMLTSEHYLGTLNGVTTGDDTTYYPPGARTLTFDPGYFYFVDAVSTPPDKSNGHYDIRGDRLILHMHIGDTASDGFTFNVSGNRLTLFSSANGKAPEGDKYYAITTIWVKK